MPEPAANADGAGPSNSVGMASRDPARFVTRLECEEFLYDEAALLDTWNLDAWMELFTPDGKYVIPSTDLIDGRPDIDLALVNDDVSHLEGRVQRLKSTWAHIENPHSRTQRMVTNVRVLADDGHEIRLNAGFITYRSRPQATTVYSGTSHYVLRRVAGELRIVHKLVALVHETLRDSGGVLSILL